MEAPRRFLDIGVNVRDFFKVRFIRNEVSAIAFIDNTLEIQFEFQRILFLTPPSLKKDSIEYPFPEAHSLHAFRNLIGSNLNGLSIKDGIYTLDFSNGSWVSCKWESNTENGIIRLYDLDDNTEHYV